MNKHIIYSELDLPVQQNRLYSTMEEAYNCPRGNLTLIQDKITGIIHNTSFCKDLMFYDENYQNEQGHSGVFRQHLDHVAEIISRYFYKKNILEIGCGKGFFLELLRMKGFFVTGVDPAYEGNATYILKKSFSPSLGVTGEAIILRHVIEHIPDPLTFLATVLEANGNKGQVYIEVPSMEWIVEHRAWFDIFYEHVNYFRLSDFSRIFGKILESGRLFGGQYIYVVADLATMSLHPKGHYDEFRLPNDFLNNLYDVIFEIKKNVTRKNAIWGAASKGVIFSLQLFRRGGISIDAVIDINQAKQGKHLPITGFPVMPPVDGLSILKEKDAIYVMNSNYFQEIHSLAGDNFLYYKVDKNGF